MRRALIIIFLALSLPALAAGTWTPLTSVTTRFAWNLGYSNGPVATYNYQEIAKSADGVNWALKTTSIASLACISVHFPTASVGYIGGLDITVPLDGNPGRYWKSIDAGETWTGPFTLSGMSQAGWIYKVFFLDQNNGWATGVPHGSGAKWMATVAKTADGGATWVNKNNGLPEDAFVKSYHGLHFYDSSRGWIVGDSGHIYQTADGGGNWVAQTSGTTQNLVDILFLKSDNQNGYIAGNGGVMLRTTNGGTNWSALTTGTTNNISALTFINPYIGYAVGANRMLLKTTDQGVTWSTVSLGSGTEILADVYFKDAFHGWLVGGSGQLYGFTVTPTVSPNTAAVGSSSYVTVTGDNFYAANPSYPAYHGFDASCLSFGTTSIEVTTLEVVSATELRARVNIFPGAVAGIYNLTVTDPDNGGTCATTFTVTSSTTGDAGPTISNISVNGESGNQVPLPSADSAASLNCEVEDTGPASVSGRQIDNPHGRIYFDTDGSSILNDPNSYEYYIPYPSYTRTSATRGTLTANLGNVYRVSDGTLAGQLAARVGTTTSFLPVVYAEDTRGNGTFQAYHRLTFVDTSRDYLLSILPSPGLTLPRTFQIFNRSFSGPVKCIIHDQLGRPLAQIDTTLTPNTRSNVVFDGTTFDGHIANGMYLLMVRAIPAIGAPISQVRSEVLGKVRFVVAR